MRGRGGRGGRGRKGRGRGERGGGEEEENVHHCMGRGKEGGRGLQKLSLCKYRQRLCLQNRVTHITASLGKKKKHNNNPYTTQRGGREGWHLQIWQL